MHVNVTILDKLMIHVTTFGALCQIFTMIHELNPSITHNDGPRLEENSQWKMTIVECRSVAPPGEAVGSKSDLRLDFV